MTQLSLTDYLSTYSTLLKNGRIQWLFFLIIWATKKIRMNNFKRLLTIILDDLSQTKGKHG